MERTGGGKGGQGRTCHPPTVKVRLPASSKVTVANYLRSGTERGLRTRAARPRAGSASARRYWVTIQYRRAEASNRSREPASSPFPLYHATRARCPVPLAGVPLHPVFPIGQGLGRAVHTPLPLGVFMLQRLRRPIIHGPTGRQNDLTAP